MENAKSASVSKCQNETIILSNVLSLEAEPDLAVGIFLTRSLAMHAVFPQLLTRRVSERTV